MGKIYGIVLGHDHPPAQKREYSSVSEGHTGPFLSW